MILILAPSAATLQLGCVHFYKGLVPNRPKGRPKELQAGNGQSYLGRPSGGSIDKSGPGFLADLRPSGWLREPRERPRVEKYCRLHQKSDPETNSKSHSWVLCVFGTDRKKIND